MTDQLDVVTLNRRPDPVDVGERRVVAAGDLGAPSPERVEPRQLCNAECAGDVVQSVVEAELVNLLVPGAFGGDGEPIGVAHESDEVELVGALRERWILGDECAALTGREILRREERERREVGQIADGPPLVRAPDGVRGIIEDERAHSCGRGGEPVVVRGVTRVVHGGDHLGPLIDEGVDRRGVDQSGVLLDIREDDVRAEDGSHRRRRDEGHGRGDDGVALSDAGRCICHVQGGRARRGGDGAVASRDLAEARLERGDRRSRCEPVPAENVDDRLDVVLGDGLAPVRQHRQIPASMISAISCWEYH